MDTPALPDRIAALAAERRRQAEQVRIEAERQIAALLTSAEDLESLLRPTAHTPTAPAEA